MNKFGLKFHHLGLATRLPEQAAAMLEGLGYQGPSEPIYDPLQHVNLALYHHPLMPDVEVIYEREDEQESPLAAILKNSRQMIYHQCYLTDDRQRSLQVIHDGGLRVMTVSEAKPAILFQGQSVSFHMVVGYSLIELLEA